MAKNKKTKKDKLKPLSPEQEAYQSLFQAVAQLRMNLNKDANSVKARYKTSNAPTDYSQITVLDDVITKVDIILVENKPVS